MKKSITLFLAILMVSSSFAGDGIKDYQKDSEALYRMGSGAEDGTYTAISSSIIGWGLGLAAGIALLTGLLHQSTAEAHTTTGHCQ